MAYEHKPATAVSNTSDVEHNNNAITGESLAPSGHFRRRASDDPASPPPPRAAVQPGGAVAYAVGTAMRYFRRASDAVLPGERLPAVDEATPELRRRVLESQAATKANSRVRLPRRWLW